MSYREEFEGLPIDAHRIDKLVEEGLLTDESWHNDAMPRFEKALMPSLTLRIWVNFTNHDDRDMPDGKKFEAYLLLGDDDVCLLATDDENLVETLVRMLTTFYEEVANG